MKTPRTDAFDPNQSLKSPLDALPAIEPASRKRPETTMVSTTDKPKPAPKKKPSTHDTTPPLNQSTVVPRHHDTTVSPLVETVRKAVREPGKEAATHRFRVVEKRAIAAIVYTYASNGIRTSENEVARIAINWILCDYEENGEQSLLHKTLSALNS